MLKEVSKSLIIIAVLFSFLSSLRIISFLPEFQFLLVILWTIKNKGINFHVLILITIILCSHHYAVPDAVFREDSGGYPSIYTKALGPIKILDLFVLFLFIMSLNKIPNLIKIIQIRSLPVILLFTSLFGLLFYFRLHLVDNTILYLIRSYLLIFFIFINCINLKKEHVAKLAILAIIAWTSKMFFAILFPHPHPWYRTILGYDGIMYFAGDEYMYIPIYLSIIIYTFKEQLNFKSVRNVILIVLLLALIAQRKGSINILIPFLLMIYFYYRGNSFFTYILKIYYIFSTLVIFIFLLYEDILINNQLINLAFLEYHLLAQSSLDSIINFLQGPFWHSIWGISPIGKIEIINLPKYVDGFMAFGEEVGERFRYQLWSFPYGRCILNAGIFGVIVYFLYYIKNIKCSAPTFYIIISTFPFCIYANITPVFALSLGLALAFLYLNQESEHENDQLQLSL